MGYKKVCLKCRLVFNRPFDPGYGLPDSCPSCQVKMKLYPHRFRPPAKTELRKWAVVRFLAEHGFNYQKILMRQEYIPGSGTVEYFVPYPETMRDAELFVQQYRHKRAKSGL